MVHCRECHGLGVLRSPESKDNPGKFTNFTVYGVPYMDCHCCWGSGEHETEEACRVEVIHIDARTVAFRFRPDRQGAS